MAMWVVLNGEWVEEGRAMVSVFDRSFTYGDGLFETLRAYSGRLFQWEAHWQRLVVGAEALKITVPVTSEVLERWTLDLLAKNGLANATVRLQLSRGRGPRGYSIQKAGPPVWVLTASAAPDVGPDRPIRWRVMTSKTVRISDGDEWTAWKTCNKLPQILAKSEVEIAGADEALLVNGAGRVAEGASTNVFWMDGGRLVTPGISEGALPGVTRSVVIDVAKQNGLEVVEDSAPPSVVTRMDTVFLTASTLELIRVIELDGVRMAEHPVVDQLHRAYRARVEQDGLR